MSTSKFEPDLSVLQAPQLKLWHELSEVPDEFVLYGGTAVALRLGHRPSIDFDFFGKLKFDPDELHENLSLLNQSAVLQKGANTLTCQIDRDGPVQVSFFGVPKIKSIRPPESGARESHQSRITYRPCRHEGGSRPKTGRGKRLS